MKAKDIMSKRVVTVTVDTTLLEVVKIIFNRDISSVLVLGENDELVGIISEKDIYALMYPKYEDYVKHPEMFMDHEQMEKKAEEISNIYAQDFMRQDVDTITEETPALKAGAIMMAKSINRLPVVDESNKIVGVISRRDIYKKIFKKKFNL